MSKFSTNKKKIQKIWEVNAETENELKIKENEVRRFFTDRYKFKQQKNIYDSGWIAKAPVASDSVRNVTIGQALSETVILDEAIDITIPENMLPFINISLMTKTIPEVQAMGFMSYFQEGWQADNYVEIYGNGSLIYKGSSPVVYQKHSQSSLDNGDFQESYTKKVYNATIEYTNMGAEYKIVGTLNKVIIRKNTGTGCGGGQEYDEWICSIDPGYVDSKNYAKFFDVDSTMIDFNTQKKEVRWITNPHCPPGDPCTQTSLLYDNGGIGYHVMKTFASADREYHKMTSATKYKKIGGNWVSQGSGNFEIDTEIGHVITLRSFSFSGYWLFYSPDTYYLFGIKDVVPREYEGVNKKKELSNLPQDPNRYWDYILFKRNPGTYPGKTQALVNSVGRKQTLFFRTSKSTEIVERYKLFIQGTIVFSALSSVKNPPPAQKTSGDDRQVVEYSDTYINEKQSGACYLPSENHTLKNRNYFGSAKEDIEYRIKIDLVNPLYWKEIRKYKS